MLVNQSFLIHNLYINVALDAQLAEKLRDAADRPEETARQLPPIKHNPPSKDKSPVRSHNSHHDDVDDVSHKFDVLLRHMSLMDTKIKRLEAERESYQVNTRDQTSCYDECSETVTLITRRVRRTLHSKLNSCNALFSLKWSPASSSSRAWKNDLLITTKPK